MTAIYIRWHSIGFVCRNLHFMLFRKIINFERHSCGWW